MYMYTNIIKLTKESFETLPMAYNSVGRLLSVGLLSYVLMWCVVYKHLIARCLDVLLYLDKRYLQFVTLLLRHWCLLYIPMQYFDCCTAGILPQPMQATSTPQQAPAANVQQPPSGDVRRKGGFSELENISQSLIKQQLGDSVATTKAFVPSSQ